MPQPQRPKPVKPTRAVRPGRILFAVPESPFTKKGSSWFILSMLVFTAFVAGLVWYRYYLQALALTLGVALFYYFAIREPARQLVAMTEKGVTFRGLRYPFAYFSRFSVWLDPDIRRESGVIIMIPRQRIRPPLTLRFEGVHYTPIRLFLRQHLAEQLHSPTLLDDVVARLLRV